ncbi:MAG: exodeoxyribonuclease alpha subunit [Verrucomicrobiota bacterium]|jgi:exodeoxyribonuclease V alpha subunit
MSETLEAQEIKFADIDRHFGRFIARFGGENAVVERTAALLSRAVRDGHICLDLSDTTDGSLSLSSGWQEALKSSPAFGDPESGAPIVIAGNRLFLRRYWEYEQSLARSVTMRARRNAATPDSSGQQSAAIGGALKNYFTIISGGPGTGKTTTVLKILEQFVQETAVTRRPRIALAAPTGKAAARIQELLRTLHDDAMMAQEIRQFLPLTASTIHRLLGAKPNSVFFKHNRANPLPLDLLIVDEASMIPLPLMAKLFDALLENTRVILLGDRDQLASVQPGAVLADMADAAVAEKSPLLNALFVLSKNFRFGNENAIYQLSNAVRFGRADEAIELLAGKNGGEVTGKMLPAVAHLSAQLEGLLLERYKTYIAESDPLKAIKEFNRFRVLCAVREGAFSVRQVNAGIEGVLHRTGLITDPSQPYAAKPILVTKNDYEAQLFNGDIGVILPDPKDRESRQLWAWFIGVDGEPRRLSPARLPEHDLAYAMTVHKAQGSQFEHVLFLLPDRDSPLLTRELIYTGLTRASKRVDVWFNQEVFRNGVTRKAIRVSGLCDALAHPR